MNILVTGSAGFVASYLISFLKNQGHILIGIDLKNEDQSHFFYPGDLRTLCVKHSTSFDVCIHLASSVGGFLHNILKSDLPEYEISLLENLKKILDQHQCSKIIYFSSINVFELDNHYKHLPLKQTPTQSPYATAKKLGEKFVEENFKQWAIVRPTNIFGAKQNICHPGQWGHSHVVPELLEKIKTQENIVVLGDGSQIRNFIHALDVCNWVSLALKHKEVIWHNLRSEIFLSIAQLVEELQKHLKSQKKIFYQKEFLKHEPKVIYPFCIKELAKIDWNAKINNFSKGLVL